MQIRYIKRTHLLIVCCLLAVLLFGCRNDDPEPTSATMPQNNSADSNIHNADWEKELQDYLETATLKETTNAVLHTGQKGNYMELHLQKGDTIDVLQKSGYDLVGYENSSGTKYVDADGRVLKEYVGNNVLLLKASFSPQEFTIRFYKDDERATDLNAIICAFDKPISAMDLHVGKVLGDDCIIGLTEKNGNDVLSAGQKEVYIENLGSCVNYSARTVDLYVKTTCINFHEERLDTYKVSTDGYLNQSLNSSGKQYDFISFEEHATDLSALKALGYENVIIQIETEIRATNGKQSIRILNAWPEDKKALDDVTIFDSGKIDLANKDGERRSYRDSATISIEDISDEIFIVYNADGSILANGEWKSECLSISITFS